MRNSLDWRRSLYWTSVILAVLYGLLAIIAPIIWAASGGDDETSASEAWAWAVPIGLLGALLIYAGYRAYKTPDKIAGWLLVVVGAVLGVLTFWAIFTLVVAALVVAGGVVILTGGVNRGSPTTTI